MFLYVFPTIGTGVGGGRGAAGESEFATILVAGVVGLSIMFQGIQAVALPMVQEFGYTREIEDRVLAPLPVALVALEKVVSGAHPGPARGGASCSRSRRSCTRARSTSTCRCTGSCCSRCCRSPASPRSALGLTFGTIFDPRTVPLLFGIIILPLTFLGGTYYSWTTLAPVTVGGVHWLQIVVLVNPLVYINEGFRAALTSSAHMSLWAVYPALIGFSALFLWVGVANFKRRVIG